MLFYTPYEAAARTIIGHRIRMIQAATIRGRLADEIGSRGAFPGPERVGPFSAELIWVCGVGDPDWLPQHEPRLIRARQDAYQLRPILEPVTNGFRRLARA